MVDEKPGDTSSPNDGSGSTGRPRRGFGQYSLRNFIVVAVVVGTVSGILGPTIVRVLTTWSPGPKPNRVVPLVEYDFDQVDGYYESGETPLH